MTPTCCAYGCLNKFKKGSGLGFYRFPLHKSRRILWTLAVRRKYFTPNKYTRICGAHFVTGKPSKDPTHPDYIPTIFKFKYSRHSKRFRKVLCDIDEVPVLETDSESSDELDVEVKEEHVSELETEPEIKIESQINLPSEIRITDVQSILDNDETYNLWADPSGSRGQKEIPKTSYTFLDIEGNVIARFVKKRVKKKSYGRSKQPNRVNPDSVRIVIENNVARIVADE